jgi:hypothetical protein
MKLTFSYDLQKDIENFLKSLKSVNNKEHTKSQEEYIQKYGAEFTAENLRLFIEQKLRAQKIDERVAEIERGWNIIATDALSRIENIFGIYPFPEIRVFLTTNNRCTYNIQENYFFVYTESKHPNSTILHELFHFYTWYAYGKNLIEQGFPRDRYNDIKESLTVILNTDFLDLVGGEIDKGYPQHQEMRGRIELLWKKERKIDVVIQELTTK